MATSTQITLTTTELLDVLGGTVTARQLQSLPGARSSRPGVHRVPLEWPVPVVHQLQVAVALQTAVSCLFRGRPTALPALFEAVADAGVEPYFPCWAVYNETAVSYVSYPADLFRAIGSGAVVAEIKALWPARAAVDTPEVAP